MKYKIAIIAIILALSVTAGCKKPANAPTPTPTAAPTEESIDLQGRTIRIMNYGQTGKLEDIYKGADFDTANEELEKIIKIQNKYNCVLELTEFNQDKVNAILSGESPADLVIMNLFDLLRYNYNNQNIFLPLDDYADILELNNPEIWNVKLQEQMAFNRVKQAVFDNYYYCSSSDVMYFNISMLKDEGLWNEYNLYEMYKNKTWNWDVFSDLCRKITRDADGDGSIDRYGLFYGPYTLADFSVSNGNGTDSSIIKFEDGNPVLAFDDPDPKAAYEMLKILNDAGCIKTIPEIHNAQLTGNEGYEAFIQKEVLFFIDQAMQIFRLSGEMSDEWGFVPIPYGPDNANKKYYLNTQTSTCMAILKNAPDPEALACILKDFMTPAIPFEDEIQALHSYYKEMGLNETVIEMFINFSNPDIIHYDLTGAIRLLCNYNDFVGVTAAFNKQITEDALFQDYLPKVKANINESWERVVESLNSLIPEEQHTE